jgi:hypothetical protein
MPPNRDKVALAAGKTDISPPKEFMTVNYPG